MTTSAPSSFPFPFPYLYQEINREALKCLKVEVWDGFRFQMDKTKFLTENWCITHRFQNHNQNQNEQPSCLNLGATRINYADSKLMMFFGRTAMDEPLTAKFKYDYTPKLALTTNLHVTDHEEHGLIKFDYKGLFHNLVNVQFYMGTGGLLGATYTIKKVNMCPHLSIATEAFRANQRTKFTTSGVARYDDGKTIATGHFRGRSGDIALSYVHKVNKEVCLASDFYYNYKSQDVRASFGCWYSIPKRFKASFGYWFSIPKRFNDNWHDPNSIMTQIKGKIDSNGVAAVLIEDDGLVFSFEFDHSKLDCKLGFGFKYT